MLSYQSSRTRRARRLRYQHPLAEALLLAYWPAETLFKSIITRYPHQFHYVQVNPGAHRFPFYDHIQTRPTGGFKAVPDWSFSPLTPIGNEASIQIPNAAAPSELTVFVRYFAAVISSPQGVLGDPIPPLRIVLPVGMLYIHSPGIQQLVQQFRLGINLTVDLAGISEWQWARLHFHSTGVTITQYPEPLFLGIGRGSSHSVNVTTGWASSLPVAAGWEYKPRDDFSYGLNDRSHSDHLLGGIFSFYGNVSFVDFWRFFYNAVQRNSGIRHTDNHLFISHSIIQTQIAFDKDTASTGYFRQPQRILNIGVTDDLDVSGPVSTGTRARAHSVVEPQADLAGIVVIVSSGSVQQSVSGDLLAFAPASVVSQFAVDSAFEILTFQPLGVQLTVEPPTNVLAQITNPIILRSFGRLYADIALSVAGSAIQPLRARSQFDVPPHGYLIATNVSRSGIHCRSFVDSQTHVRSGQRSLINASLDVYAQADRGIQLPLRGYVDTTVLASAFGPLRISVRGMSSSDVVSDASGRLIASARILGRVTPDLESFFVTRVPVSGAVILSQDVASMILFNITTMHFGQFPTLGRPTNQLVVNFFIG